MSRGFNGKLATSWGVFMVFGEFNGNSWDVNGHVYRMSWSFNVM